MTQESFPSHSADDLIVFHWWRRSTQLSIQTTTEAGKVGKGNANTLWVKLVLKKQVYICYQNKTLLSFIGHKGRKKNALISRSFQFWDTWVQQPRSRFQNAAVTRKTQHALWLPCQRYPAGEDERRRGNRRSLNSVIRLVSLFLFCAGVETSLLLAISHDLGRSGFATVSLAQRLIRIVSFFQNTPISCSYHIFS